LNNFTGFNACFRKVASGWLGHTRSFACTERYLQGNVAIILLGFHLCHTVVGHVYHRNRNSVPVVGE
jgi:kynureninase